MGVQAEAQFIHQLQGISIRSEATLLAKAIATCNCYGVLAAAHCFPHGRSALVIAKGSGRKLKRTVPAKAGKPESRAASPRLSIDCAPSLRP